MKNWKITAEIDNKTIEFNVKRYGKDGLPLEAREAMKYYVLPHIKNRIRAAKIVSIEEV